MALWGDWVSRNGASRILEAARRSDDLVALAQRLGNDEYVLQAHHSRWTNFYVMGDARISRADTLVGIRLYDPELHRWRGVGMVACGACRAFAGETEFGLELMGEGLGAQRQFGMGGWLGFTLVTAATAYMQSGDLGRALELLTEAMTLAEKSHAREIAGWHELSIAIERSLQLVRHPDGFLETDA